MYARLHSTSFTRDIYGPGVRMAIFFQGCVRKCDGCNLSSSFPMYGGSKVDVDSLKRTMINAVGGENGLDGITLTGGEPFLQPQAAIDLAAFARSKGLPVWCYSGYTWEEIVQWEDNRKTLLQNIDVLVDGPFDKDKVSLDIPWRGSSNQRLIDVKKSLEKGEVVLYGGADSKRS